ncbi:MAG: peptidoglycan-binding domain-containing protein [Christensenellales bacterium]|jgi:peptidoglycan hydrolase-like protein with peptidoglycan-binding domain
MKKKLTACILALILILAAALPAAAELLRFGDKSPRVGVLQLKLQDLNYYHRAIDNKYGYQTYKAVRNFQTDNGLKIDGVAGPETLAALGILPPPPGTVPSGLPLSHGSSGAKVKQVQERLKAMGYYAGALDSKFQDATKHAVIAFQNNNALTSDGSVGNTTWTRMFSKNAIGKVPGDASFVLRLSLHDRYSAVITLQQRLSTLGYYTQAADGEFTYYTYLCVRAFQKKNGLKVDGVVGATTWNKMMGPDAIAANAVPPPDPGAPLRIEYKDAGPKVLQIQQRLQALLYYDGAADSTFNYTLYLAVRKFQKKNGLKVDGIVGQITWDKMMGPDAIAANAVPPPDPGAPLRIKYRDEGPKVLQLQQRLQALKYYNGAADSIFNYTLYLSVRKFQRQNGLKVDGVVGEKTWNLLMSAEAKPYEKK